MLNQSASSTAPSLKETTCRVAWKNLDDMPQDQAKIIYIEAVNKLLPGVENEKAGGMGAVISRLANEAIDDDVDVPVCSCLLPLPG